MKFKYKIFLGVFIINICIVSATGSYFYFQAKEALDRAIKKELLSVAVITSKFIPGDILEKLTSPDQMNSTEYKKIQNIIAKIENSNDEFLFVYTMRLKGQHVTFIVDSPPSDDNNDGKITEDEMPYPIGWEYKNPPKSMLLGFIKPTTDDKPIKDEQGWTMSGYAPIYNSRGERVALVGIDMSLTNINKKIFLIKKAGVISLGISVLLSILLSLYFSNKFLSPLNLLKNHFKNISKGNFSVIEIDRKDEIGELFKGFNQMVQEIKEKQLLKSFLGKIIEPTLVKDIVSDQVKLGGEIVETVVMFCDIEGFTRLCSTLPPTAIVTILNTYFTEMVEIINKWGGYVDKFLGDGMLIVFGHPQKLPNPWDSAVYASMEMIKKCEELNQKLVLKKHHISNAIGIHSGPVVSGLIGSPERLEYTVIGDTVNIAQRLEKINRKLNTKISISKEVYKLLDKKIKKNFKAMGRHSIKGKDSPAEIFSY